MRKENENTHVAKKCFGILKTVCNHSNLNKKPNPKLPMHFGDINGDSHFHSTSIFGAHYYTVTTVLRRFECMSQICSYLS